MAELSPMMQQYFKIKEENKDSILFFRLGDFYEMFYDDAKLASKELELTLTGRDCGQAERAPMCGVPFHSCEGYIARLVAKGYKVAICEQTEDPAKAKGLVKRDIIRVITPGTVMESSMLDESKNNYICCMFSKNKAIGLCFCDISTGELYATEIKGSDSYNVLTNQLTSYNPREILIGGDIVKLKELPKFIKAKLSAGVEMLEDEKFDESVCTDVVKSQFADEYSTVSDKPVVVCVLGALLSYLRDTQKTGLERINHIEFYKENQYMSLDYNTQRNLELTQTMLTKNKKGSLLWVLDKTKTAMGKRLMRSWLEHPLLNITSINNRQSAVEELVNDNGKTKKKIIKKQVKATKAYRELAANQIRREFTTGEPVLEATSVTASSETGRAIVSAASKFLGVPYVWGGTTPNGFDCSGLVQYVMKSLGINVSRTSQEQIKNGVPVSKGDLQAGDLVFFESNGDVHHVGIYVGNGMMLHAPRTGDVVKYQSIETPYYQKEYAGARRVY